MHVIFRAGAIRYIGRPAHEQRLARHRHPRTWLAVVAVTAVVFALVAVLLLRAGVATASRPVSSGGPSPNWQTYHDPFGLSTLQLPPGWTAQIQPVTTWYIEGSKSERLSVEWVTLSDPSQGTGSAQFRIVAYPIKTAFDHQYYCRHPSDTLGHDFSPMSLSTMGNRDAVWLFNTENAAFQIDVTIPGVLVPVNFGPPPPPATPLPVSWVATDQTEVNEMLTSFQPTDPKPLTC